MKAVRVVTWIVSSVLFVACGGMSRRSGVDARTPGDHSLPSTGGEDAPAPAVDLGVGVDSTAPPHPDAASSEARSLPAMDAADLPRQTDAAPLDSSPLDVDATVIDTEQTVDEGVDVPMGTPEVPDPDAGAVDGSPAPTLVGAALVSAPTSEGFGLNAVLRFGDPREIRARVRQAGTTPWTELGPPSTPASDVAEWAVTGLAGGRLYQYEVFAVDGVDGGATLVLSTGSAMTKRAAGASFTFDILADSHIQPCDSLAEGTSICGDDYLSEAQTTLLDVSAGIRKDQPDFVIHLGDMLDYHRFGFNEPPPDSHWARLAYLNYRRLMVDTLGVAAHFLTIGNWEGESGCNPSEAIERSSSQRKLYLPGPKADTYPEGGSPNEDYYAFTWGDALFVVLNVMTYTPTCHLLSGPVGLPDDWTLGQAQLAWLESTLANATSKWRFTFIHHAVGGNAGDSSNSAYGRGGGRAANVGEQAVIHQMLLTYGVQIFFYGHDHVFTDMVVDGIHYTLPGSSGAPWKFDTSTTGYEQYWSDAGHARVTVSPTQVVVDFVALGGSLLSSYSLQ